MGQQSCCWIVACKNCVSKRLYFFIRQLSNGPILGNGLKNPQLVCTTCTETVSMLQCQGFNQTNGPLLHVYNPHSSHFLSSPIKPSEKGQRVLPKTKDQGILGWNLPNLDVLNFRIQNQVKHYRQFLYLFGAHSTKRTMTIWQINKRARNWTHLLIYLLLPRDR